jgi:hypothetical protein
MSYATRARTGVAGVFVARTAALPPADTADDDLFSITGQVLVTAFFGRVTAAMPAESIDLDLFLDPDDGGSNVVLATALVCDSDPVGTWYTLNPTAGGVLIAELDVAYGVHLEAPIAMDAGDIVLSTTGSGAIGTTARVSWGLTYVPLSSNGAVVAV